MVSATWSEESIFNRSQGHIDIDKVLTKFGFVVMGLIMVRNFTKYGGGGFRNNVLGKYKLIIYYELQLSVKWKYYLTVC